MPSPRIEFSLRAVRWLLPAALLSLTPKCVLCVLAYAGVGTALGLGGPEWCRIADDSPVSWVSALGWFGLSGVIGGLGILTSCRRVRTAATDKSSKC